MAEGRRLLQPPPQHRSVTSLQEPHLTFQVTLTWPDRDRAWLFPGPLLHTGSPPVQPTLLRRGRVEQGLPPRTVLLLRGSLALGEFGSCSAQVASESLGHPVLLLWGTRVIPQQLRVCPAVAPVVVSLHLWVFWSFPRAGPGAARTSWFAQQSEHLHNALPCWELGWGSWWLPGTRVHSLPLLTLGHHAEMHARCFPL